MAAADAQILLTSATHGGSALGFVQSWNVEYMPSDVGIYGEGKTGMQALGTVSESLTVTVNFLNAPFIDPTTAPATLALVGKDTAGNPHTTSCAQMKPRGVAQQGVNQGVSVWSQTFVYVGTFETFPLTVS